MLETGDGDGSIRKKESGMRHAARDDEGRQIAKCDDNGDNDDNRNEKQNETIAVSVYFSVCVMLSECKFLTIHHRNRINTFMYVDVIKIYNS